MLHFLGENGGISSRLDVKFPNQMGVSFTPAQPNQLGPSVRGVYKHPAHGRNKEQAH